MLLVCRLVCTFLERDLLECCTSLLYVVCKVFHWRLSGNVYADLLNITVLWIAQWIVFFLLSVLKMFEHIPESCVTIFLSLSEMYGIRKCHDRTRTTLRRLFSLTVFFVIESMSMLHFKFFRLKKSVFLW